MMRKGEAFWYFQILFIKPEIPSVEDFPELVLPSRDILPGNIL